MSKPTSLLQALGKICACVILFTPLSAALGQSSGAEATGPITFTFAPPHGTKLIETRVMTRDKVFKGLGEQRDRMKSRTSVTFEKVASGYIIKATALDATMTRNGKSHDDVLGKMMVGLTLSYHIDETGQLTRIEGLDVLPARIESAFPADVATALKSMITEEVLVARETAEWSGRFGAVAGATVEIGDLFVDVVPFTLPNRESITYYTKTTFPSTEPCPSGTCVRVESEYNSDADALGKFAADTAAKLVEQLGTDLGIEPSEDWMIAGTATRLMHPKTMLIFSETRSRVMKMTMDIPGKGPVATTMTEKSDYNYEYLQ